MSWRLLFPKTHDEPEEWQSTNPMTCARCDDDFDLDDDDIEECSDGQYRCAMCRKMWGGIREDTDE